MSRSVLLVVVALLSAGLIILLPRPGYCSGCADNWTAGYRSAHSGCDAGPIDAGVPYYNGTNYGCTTLWRHHLAVFSKPADSDIDCHRKTDCTYQDVEEPQGVPLQFTCSWQIQQYHDGGWHDIGATIDSDCAGCNWRDTQSWKPDIEYRAKVAVDDTPNDSPHGDDSTEYRYSSSVIPWAPQVTDYRLRSGWPQCDKRADNEDPWPGALAYRYDWSSSCGASADPHIYEHLDKVTMREKVTYDGHTEGGFHHTNHNGDNCFYDNVEDPTFGGVSGTGGAWCDTHYPFTWHGPCKDSTCTAHQLYQWATGWPEAPPSNADPGSYTWNTVGDYTIVRTLTNPVLWMWEQRITKNSGNGDCTGPRSACGT